MKSTGASNVRAGRTLTMSDDDLAYCRIGSATINTAHDRLGHFELAQGARLAVICLLSVVCRAGLLARLLLDSVVFR
jgi:hypothetical protein